MAYSRRTVVAGLGAAIAAPHVARAQAPKHYRFAYDQPRNTGYGLLADIFSNKLKDLSKGSMIIDQYPGAQLGQEPQVLQLVKSGDSEFCISASANAATLSPQAGVMSLHFLFKSEDHLIKALADPRVSGAVKTMIAETVQGSRVIAVATLGLRYIYSKREVKNVDAMKGLKVRVQGAPIWSKTFAAVGMAPTVIAYNEIYNAIQNGVISAGENEAAGVEAMKFYEVAPHLNLTQHAVSIRPICFSVKTLKILPKDLQDAIFKAGKEAGDFGRQLESSEEVTKLDALEKAGKLKRVPFEERDAMKKLADPVMAQYAKEIGAEGIFDKINVA